jgi:hypothetical protein
MFDFGKCKMKTEFLKLRKLTGNFKDSGDLVYETYGGYLALEA